MTESTPRHDHRRRLIAVGTLATTLVVGGTFLAQRDRGQEADTSPASPTTELPTTTPSTATPTTTPTTAVVTVLADGRHPVYLTGLDVAERTVEFDLIQYLTGDEADAAFHDDSPGQSGGAPNDFYIVNDNPRLRTLPIARDVSVAVLGPPVSSTSAHVIALEAFPDYLAGDLVPADDRLWYNPFWLTVRAGEVVAIEEQFTP
jgi:hypothetical protein